MDMNRPVEELEAVMGFYYKTVRQTLSSLSYPVVHVENLGNFYIKEKTLDKTLKISSIYLSKHDNLSMKEFAYQKIVQNNYELMTALKNKIEAERTRRVSVINKRFNHESEEERPADLEK